MEKINTLDGKWGNSGFKIVLKGNAYMSFFNNLRYGKGTLIYDNENFTLTSTHARWFVFWIPFVETIKGKYIYANDELTIVTVSEIEGRYSDYNGKWARLKNKKGNYGT